MLSRKMVGSGRQVLLCASLLFCSGQFTSARLLNWRRDDASNAAGEAMAAATGSTTTDAAAASTSPATVATTASESAATATSTDVTVNSSTGSAAAAATSIMSNTLNDTNDPNECHRTPEADGLEDPFCKPADGNTVIVDKQFKVTWDPDLFNTNLTNTITLTYLTDPGASKSDSISTLSKTTAPNAQGATYFTLPSSALNDSTTLNLTLSLSNPEHPHGIGGPTITLTKTNTTDPHPAPNKNKLGQEVGIPIGLVFFLALIVVGVGYLCLRRRRAKQGYGAGGGQTGREHRLAAAGDAVASGRGGPRHRRDASFHDEPTRGVELQERNRGLTGEDNWDWGSPVSSPTTATAGKGDNAFREEMKRQRGGKGV